MSSEEEATAANVLSQMSQIQQISPCETIDATVVVGHHCDVETTNTQENSQETTVEVSPEVLQQVQAAFQHELPQLAAAGFVAVTKADDVSEQHHSIIQDHGVHVVNEGMQCTTCSKPGKSYTCEHCGKKFNKSYNLKTHIRVHTGERPYQCDVCGHGFANLGDLKRHTRTHTGEKPFKCEFCGKVFSDFGSHKRHLRLHTGYKPFKCEQCDREFTRLDSFKNHLRLHTGDRPYKCVTCSKEFNYLTTYKRHLNIHKGEKPYACDLCDKKFTRQNYLKNHMNTHTKITSQECQTDTGIIIHTTDDGDQETMETSEGQTAAANLSKVSLSQLVDQADGKVTMVEQDDGKTEGFSKSLGSKVNESLLQQVTQVLGEIIPQNVIGAELTDGADGQQIVVQGGDQDGGGFKVTLAQQLLIAQHILNQAQLRTGNHGNEDSVSNTVTTLSIPEITPEIAEQIVNQVAMQHERQTGDAIISHDNIQVIEVSGNQSDDSSQAIQGHSITQQITKEMGSHDLVTEQVMEESGVIMTTSPSVQGAVYVAIDPTQPDMQQYLGEIQVLQSSANENTADKHS